MNNKGNINNNNKDINKKNLNQYSSYSHINSEKKENEYPIGKNNINDEDYKIFNEFNDKIYSLNQFDNIIKNYYFKKNNTRIRQCEYVKLGTKLYEKAGCKKYFKLPETHIKNLYAKHRNELNPYNMSDIFEYSKEIANLGDFCRGYEEKIIFKDNKEKFLHRHMIFYSNFDFKRLYVSKNISIDGTYIFPKGFNQTIIILYYDYIIYKFISAVFIIMNNKTQIGYNHVFSHLNENIKAYQKLTKEPLQWDSFTTDFEKPLINAFHIVFNNKEEGKEIYHIGCYFHFLKNCRKKLQKEGYTSLKKFADYNILMNYVAQLPFVYNIDKSIKKNINSFFKDKKKYSFFKSYLLDQWVEFFVNNSLKLNNITIKFRTNNAIENYNRRFKELKGMEPIMPAGIFINNIIDDIQNHIDHIRKIEDKEEFKNVSKTQLYKNLNDTDNKTESFGDISEEIFNYLENIDLKFEENVNLEDIEIKELKIYDNKLKEKDNFRNKHLNWFLNKNFSCAYDSITTIYIIALYKYVQTLNFNLFITEENFLNYFSNITINLLNIL